MPTDFRDALIKADGELSTVGMSPAAETRIRTRLSTSLYSQRMSWKYPVVALASCAAGVALALVLLKPPPPKPTLAGMKIEAPSAGFQAAAEGADVVVRAGEATLKLEGASVRVTRPSRLRNEARGVRVLHGRVELEVAKRAPAAAPMRVLVSDGEIEVRGTRFAVEQLENGGGAALLWEGEIVFRAPDGREVVLKPGQSVAWPLSPQRDKSFDAPEEDALAPLPVAPRPADAGADWSAHDRLRRAHLLLERIPKLRSMGADAQAAAELEAAMKQDLPPAARERLSWELIEIYSSELWDTNKGCRQVKDHAWRYPAGRFDAELQRARKEMGCER